MGVLFITPGTIPLEAFTSFGVNSKPNSANPIGFFGTGLKYAVAVLVRKGLDVRLVTKGTEYIFYSETKSFRDKKFDFVRMKVKGITGKWRYLKLPFTTELGKHWDLWQAYRELHANTLDENGSINLVQGFTLPIRYHDQTYLYVDGQEFERCYHERFQTFLPTEQDGLQVAAENSYATAYDKASKYLYYRGMRVFTLPKPSLFTYNVKTQLELTEDRTLAKVHLANYYIERLILGSDNKEFIKKVLRAQPPDFESTLNFSYESSKPSDTFRRAAIGTTNTTARSYIRSFPIPRSRSALDDQKLWSAEELLKYAYHVIDEIDPDEGDAIPIKEVSFSKAHWLKSFAELGINTNLTEAELDDVPF